MCWGNDSEIETSEENYQLVISSLRSGTFLVRDKRTENSGGASRRLAHQVSWVTGPLLRDKQQQRE